ncbi:hypothetical protein QBC46DRAFT_390178 [Diplogelasinospora grovesii]|uniref:BTB domain-containing protein n=1 Tax=Diplogelasinospora grovesii TaxID=303347 RepID=A0AAN6N3N6_9PEZI|nr:hypothetical protein QBC46DRAFT_390178 [Diplogelasinospora grovesii]
MDSLRIILVASPFANMSAVYEVDPDADVLLVVPPYTKPFASWDESDTVSDHKHTPKPSSTPELRIKASSKHLCLASPAFRNKLRNAVSGAKTTQSDGRVHLALEGGAGFDPKVVIIVMNIVHGRGSRVPRLVDFETLAQVALLVDKFQLHDAVDVYAERWIENLATLARESATPPPSYGRDLILWIFVAYVFRRSDLFKAATRVAILQSHGPIRDLGLPIRDKIIRTIDSKRQELVGHALGILHKALDKLREGKAECAAFRCDAFLLGELIKTLYRHKLDVWSGHSTKPYAGVSFAALVGSIGSVQSQLRSSSSPAEQLWGNALGVQQTQPSAGRKRRGPVQQELTPESSPEPAPLAPPTTSFDTHYCEARKLSETDLDALAEHVEGLDLESSLGYYLY